MGIFDVFKKKAEVVTIVAPMTGKIVPITDVPDPVFSGKMMGDGFAIEPTEGKIHSPITGKVLNIFPTKHAVALESTDGLEVLIHFGLETVTLKGEGFVAHVSEGDSIKADDLLVSIDLEKVTPKVPSIVTPVIFTNLNEKKIELLRIGHVTHGEDNIVEIK